MIPNPVPPITHPTGSGWKQPDAEDFQFFQEVSGGKMFVKISDNDVGSMARYDMGFPSGVYDGKMWICEDTLVWFAPSPTNAEHCLNLTAKIVGTL